MAGYVEKGRILTHELVGPSIWRMRLELPLIAKDAKPGQFIHVKVNDPTCILRRPISADAGTYLKNHNFFYLLKPLSFLNGFTKKLLYVIVVHANDKKISKGVGCAHLRRSAT